MIMKTIEDKGCIKAHAIIEVLRTVVCEGITQEICMFLVSGCSRIVFVERDDDILELETASTSICICGTARCKMYYKHQQLTFALWRPLIITAFGWGLQSLKYELFGVCEEEEFEFDTLDEAAESCVLVPYKTHERMIGVPTGSGIEFWNFLLISF